MSASPYSVLSVLSPAERADAASWRNISFHRPPALSLPNKANRTLPPQVIPRHIMQTGFTWSHAFSRHPDYVNSWIDLNPEYEYSFFGDEHARRFIERHGTPKEAAAFRRILTGAQRADLFRVVWLKVAGGVYADLDEELRTPLRRLIGGKDANGAGVPRTASAVIGTFWPFEFLLYAPDHPVMKATAEIMADGILLQVGQQRNKTKGACYSPHTCIIRVTGPLAYTSGVGTATHAEGSGCQNRIRTPKQSECAASSVEALRNMHICERDQGTVWNSWSCGFARHWDCRNSIKRRACPAKHYARTKEFFDLSRTILGDEFVP